MTTDRRPFSVRLRYASLDTDQLVKTVAFYEELLGFPRIGQGDGFVQLNAGGGVPLHIGVGTEVVALSELEPGRHRARRSAERRADKGVRLLTTT